MTAPARVNAVVAPDSFKGSLPADEAAEAIASGLRAAADAAGVDLRVLLRPVADGGEGTVAMILAAGWAPRRLTVTGPLGQPVTATFAVSPPGVLPRTAVLELATASGLTLLPDGRTDPLRATTYGTGELVAAAIDERIERVVLGIGGSATTDGGTGMATALGARFLDGSGQDLPPGGGALLDLSAIDVSGLDARLSSVEVVVASDVDNPLTGPHGAAHVYGPQKGADSAEVARLDAGLARFAELLRRDLDIEVEQMPGAGAAGGVGAGAVAFLGAKITSGIDLLLDLTGFDRAVAGKDLVVTGEGSLDHQSLSGKALVGVARRATAAGARVLVLAGRAELDDTDRAALSDLGVVGVRTLLDIVPNIEIARRDAARLLTDLAAKAFSDLPYLTPTRSPL